MSIFDFLGRKSAQSGGVQQLKTHSTDDFADGIVIELRAVVSAAIATALEALEGRYLRSVLEQSHFTLDALAIRSLDFDTMRQLEDFLNRHESIQANFRDNFFAQIVQPEYRSSRGAIVKATAPLAPLIEISAASMESETEDESYRISLKGRRIRFEAQASLGGPVRTQPTGADATTTMEPPNQPLRAERTSQPERAPTPGNLPHGRSDVLVTLRVRDSDGERSFLCALPLQLGRATSAAPSAGALGAQRIDLRSTYVSRQQLVIFEVMGAVLAMVPTEASLSCAMADKKVMQPDRVYRIQPNVPMILTAGVPNGADVTGLDLDDRGQYPQIEIALNQATQMEEGTPRPRATR